jgi:hypothetical protein
MKLAFGTVGTVRAQGGSWALVLACAGLAACGSSSGKCTSNCPGDRTDAAADGPTTAGHDAQTTDGETKHDGARDVPPADVSGRCDMTVAAACAAAPASSAFGLHCAASLSSTTSNAYLCGRPLTTVFTATCGSYREVLDTNVNVEYVYVYDSTGALYAISYHDAQNAAHCVAGPGAFVDPSDCGAGVIFQCAADGGTRG